MTYSEYIEQNFPNKESAKYKCKEATKEMCDFFPELKRVRGYVRLANNCKTPHWWCETSYGEIIDPTAKQWDLHPAEYLPLQKDAEEPLGKCLYCGKLRFRSKGADSYLCGECLSKNVKLI
jgi:hypothetical protein